MSTRYRPLLDVSPREKWVWLSAALLIVIADSATTAAVVQLGGQEVNPFLAPVVSRGDWVTLVGFKAVVVGAVILLWDYALSGRWRELIMWYALVAGGLVVLSNSLMFLGELIL